MGVAPPFPPRERGWVRGGTGLLTVAMQTARGAGRIPSQLRGVPVGAALAGLQVSWLGPEDLRESQLRGSGGVSPRFPNIPMRYGIRFGGWGAAARLGRGFRVADMGGQ